MKTLASLLIILTSLTMAYAQKTSSFKMNFDHLALSVKDLNRSVEFYKTIFQLEEITNRTANPNIRWISLGDGKELHLITNSETLVLNKTLHLALKTENLDAFINRLKEKNIPFGDWGGTLNAVTTRADGIKQIYLQDPDGYWIEINNAQ